MSQSFHPKSTPKENLHIIARMIPWKLLLFLPILLLIAIPAYTYGSRLGNNIMPGLTGYLSGVTGAVVVTTPTAVPSFPGVLPQVGSLLYTAQDGDSCDEILQYQMHMASAGHVFSEVKPETVQALNNSLGHNCLDLQPGTVLPLSPQYPLVAFGGVVLKIEATSPQQVVPTPLIQVTREAQSTVDCSDGCLLTVRIAVQTQVRLIVQTTVPLHLGAWIWAQATMARKHIANFPDYPYADPQATLDGMTLHACDLQVDNVHDDNSLSCDQITPNTIDEDEGAWLFAVTGPGGLDHWHYKLRLPAETRVLLWLTNNNGNLQFQRGNPVYRYDDSAHIYVKA